MSEKREPKIMDVTVKEGGHRVNFHVLPEQVADLAREIKRSHLQYMEISHGRGIGAKVAGYPGLYTEKELLIAARQAAPELHYVVYLSTFPYSLMGLELIANLFEIGRVGINPDEIEIGKKCLQKLKEFKKRPFAQLNRIHLRDPEEIAIAAAELQDAGAEVIYLVDTFGSMNANEVQAYVASVKAKVHVPLGFQAYNHTGRATDNTLTAYHAGAEWLDASLLGMGPGGGITSLETLVTLLKNENRCKEVDLEELTNAAKWQALPTLRTLPHSTYSDLLFAKHKIDFYPVSLLEKLSEILEISLEEFIIGLKKMFPDMTQLRKAHLEKYLNQEQLDFDVVMDYLRTGKVENS